MNSFSTAYYDSDKYMQPTPDDVSTTLDSVIDSLRIDDGSEFDSRKPEWYPEAENWLYLDPSGRVQGPFPATVMQQWYESNYFYPQLLLRRVLDTDFYTITDLLKKSGNILKPFLVNPSMYAVLDGHAMPRGSPRVPGAELLGASAPSPGGGEGLGHLSVDQLLASNVDPAEVSTLIRVLSRAKPSDADQSSQSISQAAPAPAAAPAQGPPRTYSMPEYAYGGYGIMGDGNRAQWTGSPMPQTASPGPWSRPFTRTATSSATGSPKMAAPWTTWQTNPYAWGSSFADGTGQWSAEVDPMRALLQSAAQRSASINNLNGEPDIHTVAPPTVPSAEHPMPERKPAIPEMAQGVHTLDAHHTKTENHVQAPPVQAPEDPKARSAQKPAQEKPANQRSKATAAPTPAPAPAPQPTTADIHAEQSPVSATKSKRESAVIPPAAEAQKKAPTPAPWATSTPSHRANLREIQDSEERIRSIRVEREKALAAQMTKNEAVRLQQQQQQQQQQANGPSASPARAWGAPSSVPKQSLAEIQREESRNIQNRGPAAAPSSAAAIVASGTPSATSAAAVAHGGRESPWKTVGKSTTTSPNVQHVRTAPKPQVVRPVTQSPATHSAAAAAATPPSAGDDDDGWFVKRPKQAPRRDALSQMNDYIPRPETANTAPPERRPTIVSVNTGVNTRAPLQTNGASNEFVEYCREQLRGLRANVDNFLEMLFSFPINPTPDVIDLIADSVNATSSTIDGRRFAVDFVSRRKLDAGIRPSEKDELGEGDFQVVKPKSSRRRG